MTEKDSADGMRSAEFRFYEELNEFLPQQLRRKSFTHQFSGTPAVELLVTEIGVPPSKIDLILVGDQPVSFSHQLVGGERVAVFPVFELFDISPANRLRPRPLRRSRFIVDHQLGKLARLLRLAGFDCAVPRDDDDLQVIGISSEEKRIILSRDAQLLKNARVTHGYLVRADDPPQQFREILQAFRLRRQLRPFSRCMECNGHLRIADDDQVMDRIPFAVMVAFDDFWQCEQCAKVYWKGSHYTQLARLIESD